MKSLVNISSVLISLLLLIGIISCNKDDEETDSNILETGPWVGSWTQINFLGSDDDGDWGYDSNNSNGIGFVAEITKDEWTETDDYGNGYSISSSYTVYKDYTYKRGNDTGRFEFAYDSILQTDIMYEYFDYTPNPPVPVLAGFKWKRN